MFSTTKFREEPNLGSADGTTILFNVHVSGKLGAKPVSFPSTNTLLPDEYSQMLFEGASILTSSMITVGNSEHGLHLDENAKAFVLNGDVALVFQALDIGTRAPNLR